jgi:hypothetical protein
MVPKGTLFAHRHVAKGTGAVYRAPWYDKRDPTFSDAPALVRRRESWAQQRATSYCGSTRENDTVRVRFDSLFSVA